MPNDFDSLEDLSLEDFANGSILPARIVDEENKIVDVIICDSISGGKNYKGDMPLEVGLVRKTKDGKVIYQRYQQLGNSFYITAYKENG